MNDEGTGKSANKSHYVCRKAEWSTEELIHALKNPPELRPTVIVHGPDVPEVKPMSNDQPAIWELVIEDMYKRDEAGVKKYGTRLQPFNGRDPLWDAYQEALDLVVYLRQAIFEKEMT